MDEETEVEETEAEQETPKTRERLTRAEREREKAELTFEEIQDQLELLFAAVMTAKDSDREISEMFQLLPSKTVCRPCNL